MPRRLEPEEREAIQQGNLAKAAAPWLRAVSVPDFMAALAAVVSSDLSDRDALVGWVAKLQAQYALISRYGQDVKLSLETLADIQQDAEDIE